jgi:flagellar basal body L-ring protein FlgH
MYLFSAWICINGRQVTTRVQIRADNAIEAQQIAEAQYGYGNVLTVNQINE